MTGRHKGPSVLVIKNRAIGDTILLTGSLRLLRQHLPRHEIHVLVRAPAGELLVGLPYVDRIISAKEPAGGIDRIAYWTRLIQRLRVTHYDFTLNFHASMRSSLTARCLRASIRVANHHELRGRNWFSDLKVPGRGKVKPVIERDLDVLRAIGIHATVADALPEVVLSPAEIQEAKSLFENRPAAAKGGMRIFLGIGGSRATKRWPAAHMIRLLEKLEKECDAQFVMSTVATDRHWLESFLPQLKRHPSLEKRLVHFENFSLRQTAKVVSQCSLYVGNDSGLKHLAVALGLKTVTVFGPEAPLEWHPYSVDKHPYLFIPELSCRTVGGKHWCAIPVCKQHQHRCMQDIEPEQVFQKITEVLRC
ncbi:MAG: glycosyltransferase family 9 protein [Bdellovibrionota bacterium]